jgi:hypothetical protein
MSGMPSLLGNMPGLDIEELSTAGNYFIISFFCYFFLIKKKIGIF